jgi:adenine-specific DNA-methyltransferase
VARSKKTVKKSDKKPIEQYEHTDKTRCNNPPVGLVDPNTDPEEGKKTYSYDPHLDPTLIWAGKAEHTSFEVPTVSLHVHERIDPRTVIEAVRKRNGDDWQASLFEFAGENPPLREAIEFYKHSHNWSNRLVAGDSLLVMNSLLEKEGMAGKVQMIYIDPPYGIKYGSNFQPFVNKRDVKDGKDEDLTQEPEMIKAFRDTWELGIHSYLAYLRDRLLLARELLHESGSVFVQISDENVHHVREILDEVFGKENFIILIQFVTTGGQTTVGPAPVTDYLVWYAKNKQSLKYHPLVLEQERRSLAPTISWFVELENGELRPLKRYEIANPNSLPANSKLLWLADLLSRSGGPSSQFPIHFEGEQFIPKRGGWRTGQEGIQRLINANRLYIKGKTLLFKRYFDDYAFTKLNSLWLDTQMGGFAAKDKIYAVQTHTKVIQRSILMTTDPGDLVLDPTCGSGTTAFVAEQWGRRWITCDTSRVSIALAKQRFMTGVFDYYELAQPKEGVGSGFRYKTVPHITLKSIANNEPPAQETLYDRPLIDNSRARVSGPFTVEAVPSPVVKPLTEITSDLPADDSVARSGETFRQGEWRDEIFRTGIRGKGGQKIEFSRVEPLPAGPKFYYLHADAETKEGSPQRAVISFGPDHAPLEQRQVALAIEEAQRLVPRPKLIIFAAFQFDPEAAKDIDETEWPGVTLLKVQMNADLLTDDLKKKRSSNESFWLMGQPDVMVETIREGDDKGKLRVTVLGFDYYDTRKGEVISGGTEKIAMWMLDTDYDGRSLFPRQVFFPMASEKEGWSRLARNLRAEIDEDLIEAYRGNVSLPFKPGQNQQIAVKIIDDRGIESLKIIHIGEQ